MLLGEGELAREVPRDDIPVQERHGPLPDLQEPRVDDLHHLLKGGPHGDIAPLADAPLMSVPDRDTLWVPSGT